MDIEIVYKNKLREYTSMDFLQAIRIDVYTFIYEEDINICQVYMGEEDFTWLDEFNTSSFNEYVCLAWISQNIEIRERKSM